MKTRLLLRTFPREPVKQKLAIENLTSAESRLRAMASSTFGLTHVASTKTAAHSFQKLLSPYSAGTRMRRNATYTSMMCRLTARVAKRLSKQVVHSGMDAPRAARPKSVKFFSKKPIYCSPSPLTCGRSPTLPIYLSKLFNSEDLCHAIVLRIGCHGQKNEIQHERKTWPIV
jgi:hypothetical protein